MKKLIKNLSFAIFILSLSACAFYTPSTLDKKSISNLKVEYSNIDGKERVCISGQPMHSAMIIKEYNIIYKYDSIDIIAKIEHCGSFKSDWIGLDFSLDLELKPQIKSISLDGEVIWQR